jgi:hypothetical protein
MEINLYELAVSIQCCMLGTLNEWKLGEILYEFDTENKLSG